MTTLNGFRLCLRMLGSVTNIFNQSLFLVQVIIFDRILSSLLRGISDKPKIRLYSAYFSMELFISF